MELTWIGYRIRLEVRQEEVHRGRLPLAKHLCDHRLSQQRQQAHKQHLLTSDCRYVAPTR
jgi:hypothetical protein